jgi:hypothetical protein
MGVHDVLLDLNSGLHCVANSFFLLFQRDVRERRQEK